MSEICKNWSTWLYKTRFSYMNEVQIQQTVSWLLSVRDKVLDMADIHEGQKVADFGCGTGLLAFGVLERFEDRVETIFSDKFVDCLGECEQILKDSNVKSNAKFVQSDICDIWLAPDYLDRAMTRSVLVHVLDKQSAFCEIYRVLKPDGYYCGFEPLISQNTRYYELLLPDEISDYFEFKKAEKEFMENPNDPLVNFTDKSLKENLQTAGFSDVELDIDIITSKYIPQRKTIESWFTSPPAPDQKTMKERYLEYFDEEKVDNYIEEVKKALLGKEISLHSKVALIKAKK